MNPKTIDYAVLNCYRKLDQLPWVSIYELGVIARIILACLVLLLVARWL